MERRSSIPLLSAAFTIVMWASAFVGIRIALHAFTPAQLTVTRLVVAAVLFLALLPFIKVRKPDRRDLPRLISCAALGMTGYQFLLNAGERSINAGTASLLVNTAPVFAAILAWVMLRERPTRQVLVGISIAFAGAVLIALDTGGGFRPSIGVFQVFGAAFAQAAFFVLQKPLLTKYRPLEVTAYVTWMGACLALPLAGTSFTSITRASSHELMAVLYLGVGPSALGFTAWAIALAAMPVARLTALLYLVPAVAILIGWVTLGERVGPLTLTGGAIAIAGVAVSRSRRRFARTRAPGGTRPRN